MSIAETYRLLLYDRHIGRTGAITFLNEVYEIDIEIISPSQKNEQEALVYLRKFDDQDISYTDAINMAVMKNIGLLKVFCFDWHYSLLGFESFPQVR